MGTLTRSIARMVKGVPVLTGLGRSALRLLPDIPCTIQVQGVGPVRIRLRRNKGIWIWNRAFLLGTKDPAMGILNHLIRPGDVVYDVGSNIGLYARVMVQWFGADQVVCFEPMSENFELLKTNVTELNGSGKFRIFNVALGDSEGEEELQVDDMTSGSAVLDRVSGGKPSTGRRQQGLPPKTETVKVVPLDTLIERQGLRPPDVMKIDTEGAAALVLAGAHETIDRYGPRIVVSRHNLAEAEATVQKLGPLGYTCYGMVLHDGNKVYQKLEPGDEPNMPRKCDMLCSRTPADVEHRIDPITEIPQRAVAPETISGAAQPAE